MPQALSGGGSLRGLEGQHGAQEAREGGGGSAGPLVFLLQHRPQPPWPQVPDVAQLPWGWGQIGGEGGGFRPSLPAT